MPKHLKLKNKPVNSIWNEKKLFDLIVASWNNKICIVFCMNTV